MSRTTMVERQQRTPSDILALRDDAVAQMPPALQRMVVKIEKTIGDIRAMNLSYYHTLGKLCLEIQQNPEKYRGNNGVSGLTLVEQALSTQNKTLRQAALFADAYDDEQLKQLIHMQHKETGFQLNWGHVIYLLALPTPRSRYDYAVKAIDEMLDPRALHEEIRKHLGSGGAGGRPHTVPRNISAQVRQIYDVCRGWVGKHEKVWDGEEVSTFTNILEADAGDLTDEILTRLTDTKELMQKIVDYAQEDLQRLDRIVEYVDQAISTRREESVDTGEEDTGASTDGGRASRDLQLD